MNRVHEPLEFRLASVEDANALFPIWTDDDVTKYTMIANISNVEDCEKRILRQLEWTKNDSIGPFVILERETVIGYCGGTREGDGEYEIFYHIAKRKWGNGLGTEIAKKLVELALSERRASVVRAKAVVENERSWRVLERLGMTRKERIEKAFRKSDRLHDMYVYEMERK